MASSSDNESDNSMEEMAPAPAPTRRTRSGRAPAAKPASRRGRGRKGGTPTRATRTTRKSLRHQQEQEEAEEIIEQDQGSEPDELKGLDCLPDEALHFESDGVEPMFAELSKPNLHEEVEGDSSDHDTLDSNGGREEQLILGTLSTLESAPPVESEEELQNGSGSDGEEVAQKLPDSDLSANDSGAQEALHAAVEEAEMEEDKSQDVSEQHTVDSPVEQVVEQAEEDDSQPAEPEEMECQQPTAEEAMDEEAAQAVAEASEAPHTADEASYPTKEASPVSSSTAATVKSESEAKPPSEKKRKRRGFSDAPVEDPPVKKQLTENDVAVNGEQADLKEENASSPDSGSGDKPEHRRKKLPELAKYWKAVKEDSTDFTGWTYLLQYVDQETDVEAAREAYDAFLSLYPYCYGYWRKFADYEKKKGTPEFCDQVFERGLRAIPLSVDLWLHYLNHYKASHPGEDNLIRAQFERALDSCGLEFRSDRLWESYIKWELENKNLQNVTAIYDRLLATPTQGYTGHFDSFEALAKAHLPQKLLSVDEFLETRKAWLAEKQAKEEAAAAAAAAAEEEEGTGEEEPSIEQKQKDEIESLRDKLVESRKEVHKTTVVAVSDRWLFEEGIKRPYFHVKPLEKSQLRNWREYLEFEIEKGDQKRIIVLFERCLIACALYEEFWVRFLQYLEDRKDNLLVEKIRDVYQRACTIHHVKKANLHLHWAAFEEKHKRWEQASTILENLEKQMPGLLQLAYRRINLERRRGNLAQASALYESYVSSLKNQTISTNLAIKHARFCCKVKGDLDGAIAVLDKALEKDKVNSRLYLQLIDMHMQRSPMDVDAVVAVFDRFLQSEASSGSKATFAQRKLEFLEDFGHDIESVLKAQEEQQQWQKSAREAKKGDSQEKTSESGSSSGKKGKSSDWTPPIPSQPPPPHPPAQYGPPNGPPPGYPAGQPPPGYPPQYSQQGYQQSGYQYPPPTGAAGATDPNYYQNWGGYPANYNQGWGSYNYY